MTRDSSARVKAIDGRLGEISVIKKVVAARIEVADSEMQTLRNEERKLRKERDRLFKNGAGLVITEHAMIRYMERVMGIDLDDVRSKILPDSVREAYAQLGTGGEYGAGTHRVKIKDDCVITVLA